MKAEVKDAKTEARSAKQEEKAVQQEEQAVPAATTIGSPLTKSDSPTSVYSNDPKNVAGSGTGAVLVIAKVGKETS